MSPLEQAALAYVEAGEASDAAADAFETVPFEQPIPEAMIAAYEDAQDRFNDAYAALVAAAKAHPAVKP